MQDILKMWCKHHHIEYYYDVYSERNTFRKYNYDNENLCYRANQLIYFDNQLENIKLKDLNDFLNMILEKLS